MASESKGKTTEVGKRSSGRSEKDYSVRSLERALSVLECFGVDHRSWTLVDLSRCTGLHKATAFRLVKTLEAQGFLGFDQTTGEYYLGSSLLRLAYLAHSHEEIVRIARPHLERLAETTGETADLAIWSGEGVLFLDQVLTSRPFKPQAQVGRHFVDLRNSHVRVVAAFGREEWREKLIAESNGSTSDEVARLVEGLDDVRRRGLAFDLGVHTPGICAVSAPVLDASGRLLASISVVAPDHRFDREDQERYADAVKGAALELSHDFGYAR